MNEFVIPEDKLCDSGCGEKANYFSHGTGRYRCRKSASSCPANRAKNSLGIKKAHKDGRVKSFSNEAREKSQISYRRNLVEGKSIDQLGGILRKKIVMEEQEYKCSHCGLDEWMGLRITLELDHIDGNRDNNIRENLRCLCPNCHSITETWKRGGTGKRKCTDKEIIDAYEKTGSISGVLRELNMNRGSGYTVKKVLYQYKLIDE